jgi:hypothetical protein
LQPEQYTCQSVDTIIENEAAPTENIHAKGIPTVRIYRIFEATISDTFLIKTIPKNSEDISHEDLCELALKDAQSGGKGRATAVLVLPLKQISDFYLAMSPKERNAPVLFAENRLDETVPAILDGIAMPKYKRHRKS